MADGLVGVPAISTTQTASAPRKRIAIVGTASTWKDTPWDDAGLEIASLNDAYMLGIPRANWWFDLHPFHQMVFKPKGQKVVDASQVPPGAYLRPEGHLEWLQSRPYPVYLQSARPDWPTSRTFPRAALEAKYGGYFASSPAWMLAWAMEEGYQEIHIYGIHLATQWEYVHQRPNLEWLMGIALQKGHQLVLPARCPLMKSRHAYAFEAKPEVPLDRVQRRIDLIKTEGARVSKRAAALPWWARRAKADAAARLELLDLELQDAHYELHRVQALQHAVA